MPANEYGALIARGKVSYIRLSSNQWRAGYTVVGLDRHACELYELSDPERADFWSDVVAATRAIARLFSPVKINTAVMGHLCPHVHCHVIPRFDDDDPHCPFDPNHRIIHLDQTTWDERLHLMRDAVNGELRT